jgi:hypothetical protein
VLAADFDGPMAMLDALAYLKAARAWSVPAALEVSRSGWVRTRGCSSPHPVPAETARFADQLRQRTLDSIVLRGE